MAINFLFIGTFFLTPCIILLVMERVGFPILKVGLVQFTLLSFLIFGFVGTLPLYFGWDAYRYEMGVTDQYLVLQIMLMSASSIFLFLFGSLFVKSLLKAPGTPNSFKNLFIPPEERWLLLGLLLCSGLVLYSYLSQVSSIAILVAFLDETSGIDGARSVMGNDFSGKYHWYSLFMHDFASLATFACYSLYLKNKRRLNLVIFLSSLCLSSFASVMTAEKGPVIWLFIGLVVVRTIVIHGGRYQVRRILVPLLWLSFALAYLYMVLEGSGGIFNALSSIISRAFAGSIQPAYHYLEFFPKHHEFLLGRSFPNPGGLLPHDQYNLTQVIAAWVSPELTKAGIVGSAPTIFWAEAYANFSYSGVVVVSFILGALMYLADYLLRFLQDTPIKIGVYVWALLHYKNLSVTGFTDFILDTKIFLIVLFLLFSTALVTRLSLSRRRRQ